MMRAIACAASEEMMTPIGIVASVDPVGATIVDSAVPARLTGSVTA